MRLLQCGGRAPDYLLRGRSVRPPQCRAYSSTPRELPAAEVALSGISDKLGASRRPCGATPCIIPLRRDLLHIDRNNHRATHV
mmetsp:Transcript_25441/g.77236  ORF Transcript_25441/g.77236 Transcript_25441/m.77236 type:complete len:83 (+) Transcript_25441:1392-1640(+)